MAFDARSAEEGLEFTEVVASQGRMVLGLARRLLGKPGDAEDVYQEVFLALWRVWTNSSRPASLSSYLYRTTVRECMRRIKKRQPEMTTDMMQVRDQSRGPQDHAQLRELEEHFQRSLAQLPEREALAFALRRLEGLAYADVAQALDCSQETARVYVHRAAVRLSRLLKDHLSGKEGN